MGSSHSPHSTSWHFCWQGGVGDPNIHLTCCGFMAKDSIEEGGHPDAATNVRAHTYD